MHNFNEMKEGEGEGEKEKERKKRERRRKETICLDRNYKRIFKVK